MSFIKTFLVLIKVHKELSTADKFMYILENISESDINGYDINDDGDDYLSTLLTHSISIFRITS